MASTTRYTATHGVSFADAGIAFEFDREATGSSATKVYAADLTAAEVKKLEGIDKDVLAEYGIEKDATAKADESDKSEDK